MKIYDKPEIQVIDVDIESYLLSTSNNDAAISVSDDEAEYFN